MVFSKVKESLEASNQDQRKAAVQLSLMISQKFGFKKIEGMVGELGGKSLDMLLAAGIQEVEPYIKMKKQEKE